MDSNFNLKNIKLIIIEFDGCISDGLIHLDKKGNQLKNFNIQDADIITELASKGYKIGIISKYNISFMKKYLNKWKLAFIASKIDNKLEWINKYIKDKFIIMSQVGYFGCSISSLNIIDAINCQNGLTGCPHNSYRAIIENSLFVSDKNGGFGAVSDFLDLFNYHTLNLNKHNTHNTHNTHNKHNKEGKYNLNHRNESRIESIQRRQLKKNINYKNNIENSDSDTDERLNERMKSNNNNNNNPETTVNLRIPHSRFANYSGDEWDATSNIKLDSS